MMQTAAGLVEQFAPMMLALEEERRDAASGPDLGGFVLTVLAAPGSRSRRSRSVS
jgi:hypothetical protein